MLILQHVSNMADTGGKKKGKKQKNKTVSLNAFLSGESQASSGSSVVYTKSSNWADESEDLPTTHGSSSSWSDGYTQPKEVQRIVLPTAPRAARAGAVDLSQLPKGPPYTAFLGNLPYDVEEEDIYHFFSSVQVADVRLPRESENGRLKGFGYAEFGDIDVFLRALQLDDETLKGRRIRVDIAGQGQGTDRDKDNRGRDMPSESDGDWRRGPKESAPPLSRPEPRGGEERRGYKDDNYGRTDNSDTREWRRAGDRDGGGRSGGDDAGYSGQSSRDRYVDRGGGYEDRGGSGDRSGYGDRGGYGGRAGYGNRGGYGDRDGYHSRRSGYGSDSYGGDRRGFGGSDRDRGFGGGDRDRGFGGGDRDRGFGGGDRDRNFGGGNRDRGFGGGDRDRGFGGADRDRGFGGGDRDRGFGGGDRNRGFGGGDRDRGFGGGDRDRGFGGGDRDRGFGGGDRDRGFGGGDRDRGFGGGDRDRGFGSGDRDRGFGGGDRDRGDQDRWRGNRDEKATGDNQASNDQEPKADRPTGQVDEKEKGDSPLQNGERTSEKEDKTQESSDGQDKQEGKPDVMNRRENTQEPRGRPRLQLKPRSAPKEDSETSVSSSAIFGGAKPVNTAAREMEIASRLEKEHTNKETAAETNDGKSRHWKTSEGDGDGDKIFEKSPPSSGVRRDHEDRGGIRGDHGRGRSKAGRDVRKEPRPVELKKYEEPEGKNWVEENKYSLLETEDDDVDLASTEEEEEECENTEQEKEALNKPKSEDVDQNEAEETREGTKEQDNEANQDQI